jgi:hypothetical protein
VLLEIGVAGGEHDERDLHFRRGEQALERVGSIGVRDGEYCLSASTETRAEPA